MVWAPADGLPGLQRVTAPSPPVGMNRPGADEILVDKFSGPTKSGRNRIRSRWREGGSLMDESRQVRGIPTSGVPPGTVAEAGEYALCNINGEYFALSRWCRHRGGDLAKGSIDEGGCLVCPIHGARYDVRSGQTIEGPRLLGGRLFKSIMNRKPLERGKVEVRDGSVFVR